MRCLRSSGRYRLLRGAGVFLIIAGAMNLFVYFRRGGHRGERPYTDFA
jgi:hypothetical protein